MKRASSDWCATERLSRLAAASAAVLLAGCTAQPAPVVHYTRAEMTRVPMDALSPYLTAPAPDATWTAVELPLLLRPAAGERAGGDDGRYDIVWLRFAFEPQIRGIGQLYLPRVTHTNFPQLRTRLALPFDDAIHSLGPRWNVPLRIAFDPAHLPSPHTLELGLARTHGRQLLVSPAWAGAVPSAIDLWYRTRLALQSGLPMTLAATLAIFAAFAFAFWLRRRERLYLIAAAAMAAWVLRLLHYFVGHIPDGAVSDWFWWASITSMLWVMLFTYQFALRLHEMRMRWVESGLLAFAAAVTLATSPLMPVDVWRGGTLVYGAAALVSVAVTLLVTGHFLRHKDRSWGLIAACLWLSLAFGVHDLGLRAGWVHPQSIYLMPLSALLIFGVFGYAILERYAGAISALERSNLLLDERVNLARRALEDSYAQLSRSQAERAAAAERERLVRDMHDGIGSALTSSLLLAEQGRLDDRATADMLRQCIEDLRLTIDSTDAGAGDLVTLLATLRFRIGSRLAAAGIAMAWEVEEIPPLPWLTPDASLQVLRIVQEALTNVIKHAHASRVRLAISHEQAAVRVRIEDDGCGFAQDVSAAGRGLTNQRRRAAAIGASIAVASGPAGTCVTLTLPLAGAGTARAA